MVTLKKTPTHFIIFATVLKLSLAFRACQMSAHVLTSNYDLICIIYILKAMEIQINVAVVNTHKGFSAASVRSVLPACLLACLLGALECDAVCFYGESSLLPTVFVDHQAFFHTR